MCESNAKSSTLKSRKARSYDPFNEFTNSVHLTKSCGSGLLLNNLRDPSIIDRPILISYVSIAATRTYEVGHVRPLCPHTYVPTCALQLESETQPCPSRVHLPYPRPLPIVSVLPHAIVNTRRR